MQRQRSVGPFIDLPHITRWQFRRHLSWLFIFAHHMFALLHVTEIEAVTILSDRGYSWPQNRWWNGSLSDNDLDIQCHLLLNGNYFHNAFRMFQNIRVRSGEYLWRLFWLCFSLFGSASLELAAPLPCCRLAQRRSSQSLPHQAFARACISDTPTQCGRSHDKDLPFPCLCPCIAKETRCSLENAWLLVMVGHMEGEKSTSLCVTSTKRLLCVFLYVGVIVRWVTQITTVIMSCLLQDLVWDAEFGRDGKETQSSF